MLALNIPPSLPPKLASRVLIGAVAAAAVTDALLRATPWGVNVPLAIAGLVLAALPLVVGAGHGGRPGPGAGPAATADLRRTVPRRRRRLRRAGDAAAHLR